MPIGSEKSWVNSNAGRYIWCRAQVPIKSGYGIGIAFFANDLSQIHLQPWSRQRYWPQQWIQQVESKYLKIHDKGPARRKPYGFALVAELSDFLNKTFPSPHIINKKFCHSKYYAN